MHQEKSGSFKIYVTQLHIIINSLHFGKRLIPRHLFYYAAVTMQKFEVKQLLDTL